MRIPIIAFVFSLVAFVCSVIVSNSVGVTVRNLQHTRLDTRQEIDKVDYDLSGCLLPIDLVYFLAGEKLKLSEYRFVRFNQRTTLRGNGFGFVSTFNKGDLVDASIVNGLTVLNQTKVLVY